MGIGPFERMLEQSDDVLNEPGFGQCLLKIDLASLKQEEKPDEEVSSTARVNVSLGSKERGGHLRDPNLHEAAST